MPTPEVTPIPGLCISQSNLTTFINNLNLSFDLMVQTINEELAVSLTLPGIPPIPLAGMPSISIPKYEAIDINRRFARQPGLRGYVGNVFPVSQGGKGLGGKYTLPGYPGFNVEGFQGQIPGIDPSTYIINLLNQNYQILVQQLAEEGVTVEVTEIPQLDLCGPDNTQAGQQPGGTSPGATTVVNIVNQNNQNILNGLPAGCVSTISTGFTPLTDSLYSIFDTATGSHSVTATNFSASWPDSPPLSAFSGAEIDGWNPFEGAVYHGAAPTQLSLCGRTVRLDYSYSLSASDPAVVAVTLTRFGSDNIQYDTETNQHFSGSGSDSLTISFAGAPEDHRLSLTVFIGANATSAVGGNGSFTYNDLVDLGP